MLPLFFALLTFVSTALGGFFALSHRSSLRRILAFTSGVLVGVVAFDLLPEIFRLTNETKADVMTPMVALAVGFLVYYIAEKVLLIRHARGDGRRNSRKQPSVGIMSALALSGDSYLDGVGIGIAFHVSEPVGLVVALAIIIHDFTDGLNTVTLMLANRNTKRKAISSLAVDALAPALGVFTTSWLNLAEGQLLLYLAFFAGFLLYMGAADIMPEANVGRPSSLTVLLTVSGVVVTYIALRFIGS